MTTVIDDQRLKAVFHFKRIVSYRSIFFCVEVISSTLVLRKQRNTLRFATIRLKWKTGLIVIIMICSATNVIEVSLNGDRKTRNSNSSLNLTKRNKTWPFCQ
jgi:uncharacterized membrane protein